MTTLRSALQALDEADVPYCVRNGGRQIEALAPGDDLDVLVPAGHVRVAERVLLTAGLHRLAAPGHDGHRFFVAFDGTDWRKLDLCSRLRYGGERVAVEPVIARRVRYDGVWVAAPEDEDLHRARRRAGQREPRTALRQLKRKRPAGLRRRGAVVAVLGPDGAGKGSTLDGAVARLPVAVTRVYLGNQRSGRTPQAAADANATHHTPSTRPPALALRESLFLVRKALPLYRRLAHAYAAAWKGHLVLCDRHPVEVLAIRPQRTPVGAALERLLFAKVVPSPDRIVVLDAPGEVLWARKGEHDPETLEAWRQRYLATFVPPAAVVPTTGPVQDSVDALLHVLWDEMCRRNRWSPRDESSR